VPFPNRVKRRAHQPEVRIGDTLWRDFAAIHTHAQILGLERRPFRQTHFHRTKRAISGVVEAIDNTHVKPSAARRIGHGANFSLAIDETEARAERLHATRSQKCPCAKGGWKEDAEPRVLKQDEMILPGLAMRVKTWPVISANQSDRVEPWPFSPTSRRIVFTTRAFLVEKNKNKRLKESGRMISQWFSVTLCVLCVVLFGI
jgi:hypothetical protein